MAGDYMENTTYRELADSLFNKIKDYDFLAMEEDEAYEIVETYIPSAAVKFQNCSQDLNNRNELLSEFNFRLTAENYELIVNYMLIEWLTSNYITTGQALKPRLTTSEFHASGQKDLLEKSMKLRSLLKEENDQLAINKSYSPSTSKLYKIASGRKKV